MNGREKNFRKVHKYIIKLNHKISAKSADINIADNNKLKDSLLSNFQVDSKVIRYGGDQELKEDDIRKKCFLEKYQFIGESYYISVSRAQVDNNLHLLLETFLELTDLKLVLISNWNVSKYGRVLKQKYINKSNLFLLDAVYDIEELNYLRRNAKVYIHSHSRCGTSPSLVEAMFLKIPIICFDVPTNRETTKGEAYYFHSKEELREIIYLIGEGNNVVGDKMYSIANKEYRWEQIAKMYLEIFQNPSHSN